MKSSPSCAPRTAFLPVSSAGMTGGAFRFAGVLDFSLVGILAEASAVLARRRIGLFAVSTFNRSYIFVKQAAFEQALAALAEAGYTIDRCPVSR